MILLLVFMLAPAVTAESVPEWFLPLRDSVYEQQMTAAQIKPLYQETVRKANVTLASADLCIALSRCEYMMGRAYQYEEKNDDAARHYTEGINWAEKALKIKESSQAYQMLAENISQSCAVRSVSYAMANGLKVEKNAKSALALNGKNAAAQIMIAARWVYAPAPFHNYKKGIEMMSVIPSESVMDKDDAFNVNIALAYVYIQQKNYAQAKVNIGKALQIYPTNQYSQKLLAQVK
jgi:Tfp pilus assembly protein PilF